MPKASDLTGRRFGRLVAISRHPSPPSRWLCRCDCGAEKLVVTAALVSGNTTGCGCRRRPRSTDERFEAKVDRNGPPHPHDPSLGVCHMWTAKVDRDGYGRFRAGDGKTVGAHRFALERALGRPLREGMCACHSCDREGCVNDAHLWEGTSGDNTRDASAKGRLASQCGDLNGVRRHPGCMPSGDAHWTRRHPEKLKVAMAKRRAHRGGAAA